MSITVVTFFTWHSFSEYSIVSQLWRPASHRSAMKSRVMFVDNYLKLFHPSYRISTEMPRTSRSPCNSLWCHPRVPLEPCSSWNQLGCTCQPTWHSETFSYSEWFANINLIELRISPDGGSWTTTWAVSFSLRSGSPGIDRRRCARSRRDLWPCRWRHLARGRGPSPPAQGGGYAARSEAGSSLGTISACSGLRRGYSSSKSKNSLLNLFSLPF